MKFYPLKLDTVPRCLYTKIFLKVKITFTLLIITALQVSATTYAQKINISRQNVPLEQVFMDIKKQTGYNFLYVVKTLEEAKNVTISVNNASLEEVLKSCLEGQPLYYVINAKTVVIKRKQDGPEQKIPADWILTGKVTDENGGPLMGATVRIKGVSGGTISDKEGKFSIRVSDANDSLSVSFIGYENRSVKIGNAKTLTIQLSPAGNTALGEVVVVGYGTQKRVTLTSAVETISEKEIGNRAVPSVINILQGEAGGLNIQQTDGTPGYGSNDINIRGNSTISNNPVLYIVDGMAVADLSYLNPADIASVSILKDASATAIYGARASGGVLLITTKKGKLNTTAKLVYDAMLGFQKSARLPKFVEAPEFVDLYNQAQLNDNPNAVVKYTPDLVSKYKSGQLPSTNWLPYILSNQAIQQQHNLSVSGGSKDVDYFVSGGYLDQGGLIKNVDYKRYNTHFNVNAQVSKRLKLGISSVLSREEKELPAYGLGNALQWSYIVPVTEYPYTAAGHDRSYRGGSQPNDIMTNGGIQNEAVITANTNFMAEFKILDNLILNGTYGYNYRSSFLSAFYPKYALYNDDEQIVTYANNPNSVYKENTSTANPTALLTLNYNKTIGKHEFKALVGYSQEQSRYDFNSISRYGFLTNELDQVDAGSSDPTLTSVSGNATSYSIQSGFGRLNYNYDGKYLLETSARYDGSSVFLNKRFRFFPSMSAGWVLSKEDFFKTLSPVIGFLKLRFSYGQVGNQNAAGLYPYANTIAQDKYILNKTSYPTTYYNNSPNADLTWEVKTTANIGLDMTLLKDLDLSVDLFQDRTTGILRSPTVPTTYGIGAPQQNAGKLQNQGFEIKLGYHHQDGDFSYRASVNFSDARNKILDLGGTGISLGDNPLLIGQSRWIWYGLKADGLFQSQDEINNHATQNPRTQPGDIKFRDVNGDGKINSDDRMILGQATPHYRFGVNLGLTYQNFDVSMLLQGVLSNSARLSGGAQVPFFFNGDGNILTSQLDYWSPDNRDAKYPILRTDQSINNGQFSSAALVNAAYLRFKNLQVGYTFSKGMLRKLKVSSVRVFAAADNLFVLTGKDFPNVLDPEIPNYGDGSNYPQVRNLSLGLNVVF